MGRGNEGKERGITVKIAEKNGSEKKMRKNGKNENKLEKKV